MSLSLGIVGLPNVGKSTLFRALTKKQVPAENYPFTTVDPNVGVVEVPDERLAVLAKLSKSAKIIPATVSFVDIAGLVKGAHKGEGLGNKFLAAIREVDAIVEVVRAFTDENVIHVAGGVNPGSDIATIDTELALADLATVERRTTEVEGKARSGDETAKEFLPLFERLRKGLGDGKAAREVIVDPEERQAVRDLNLLTLKPILYLYNVDEGAVPKALPPNALTISAKIEAEIAELPPAEATEYLKQLGQSELGLNRLIRAGYALLDLITFFTSGPKETRAWTVRRGAKAPEAAGVIHSDFDRGFIRAEVIGYDDFVAAGGEAGARERGTLRLEGKDYIVRDGDVAHFRFNVS